MHSLLLDCKTKLEVLVLLLLNGSKFEECSEEVQNSAVAITFQMLKAKMLRRTDVIQFL